MEWVIKVDEIFLEEHKIKLSFAILLLDAFTKGNTLGRVDVSLQDLEKKPIKNPGSYYLFFDLVSDQSAKNYTLQVSSDYYLPEDLALSVSLSSDDKIQLQMPVIHDNVEIDSHYPLITVNLKPNPSYPFRKGVTLIRGMLLDSSDKEIPQVRVWIEGTDMETLTSEKGEFLLYFGPLKEEDIEKVEMEIEGVKTVKRFVKVNGNKNIQLKAKPGGEEITKEINVEEGETTVAVIK